jgi:hypothetical protein
LVMTRKRVAELHKHHPGPLEDCAICRGRLRAQAMAEAPIRLMVETWSVGIGESFTELGTVWPVIEDHGKCEGALSSTWCGQVDMKGDAIAYFKDRKDAQAYAAWKNSHG